MKNKIDFVCLSVCSFADKSFYKKILMLSKSIKNKISVPTGAIAGLDAIASASITNELKSVKLIRPTIHKYLAGYTKSQYRRIDADEWTIATLLPVQRFKKASDKEVWRESKGMI